MWTSTTSSGEAVPTEGQPERDAGRYGPWTGLVLELAGGDHDDAERIVRWPLRVALHAYRARMKMLALEDYRHRFLCWCVTAPHAAKGSRPRPPEIPEILRGRHGHP